MRITTSLSTQIDIIDACQEAATEALDGMQGAEVDICFVFVSGSYGSRAAETPMLLTDLVDPTRLVGCAAGGVIGGGVEIEGLPAVSITLVSEPNANFEVTHLIEQELPDDDSGPHEWVKLLTTAPHDATGIVLLPDPYFSTSRLLSGLDFAYPSVPKVGGLVSGASQPGGNMIFRDQTIYHEGVLAIVLSGDVALETVVAQGCKPFGKIGELTKVEHNQVFTIDGAPGMQFLQEQLETLSGPDIDLARTTPLFLGVAMDPFSTETPKPGEFLIRNMLGFDPTSGSLAIGAEMGVGRKVQFHLRDRESSSQDLEAVLQDGMKDGRLSEPGTRGALLFSCLGRGEHLYGRPNHDSEMFHRLVGRVPLGGFFCNGEIGPVQGATYLHGYTSAFGVLCERERDS